MSTNMAELKTKPNDASVSKFIEKVDDSGRKSDCFELIEIMKEITGEPPKMWGDSIVGFGSYHYKYSSGREADWLLTGFSPRKLNLTMYIMSGLERYEQLLTNLGKYKTGKSCLYVKRLDDIDKKVLKSLIGDSVKYLNEKYNR